MFFFMFLPFRESGRIPDPALPRDCSKLLRRHPRRLGSGTLSFLHRWNKVSVHRFLVFYIGNPFRSFPGQSPPKIIICSSVISVRGILFLRPIDMICRIYRIRKKNILASRAKPVISNHPVNPVECGRPLFSLCTLQLCERRTGSSVSGSNLLLVFYNYFWIRILRWNRKILFL